MTLHDLKRALLDLCEREKVGVWTIVKKKDRISEGIMLWG